MSLQQAITEFRSQFRGEVLEPRAPGYDEAQSLYCDDRSQAEADRQVRRRRRCDSRRADGEGQRLRVSNRGVGHNAAKSDPPARHKPADEPVVRIGRIHW